MRSLNQIARTLSGRTRLEERAELASADTYTLIGVATTDSSNGSVRIRLTDSVTRAGWDEEGTDIEVPTNGHVREGQRVYVTCFGGSMQEMVVSGAVGEGDELRADVNTALSEAEIAHEAADAAVEDAGLAKQAAQQAAGSAESAAQSAANAAGAASNAEADARRAEQSASSAQSSASTAATAASNAQTSAGQAASSASAAAQSASDAQGSAATAASAAQQAVQDAAEAKRQSGLAQTAADEAKEQAGNAEQAAKQATSHANSALVQLSTVEDVIGTVNWIAEHGEYVKTTDTAIDPDKVYYVKQGDLYHPVAEPDVADIATYYELHVDDALSDFVASHIALTDAGLYVLKDADAWKTLVRNDGFEVQDPAGVAAISVDGATGIGFDANRPMRIGTDSAFIIFTPASGSDPATIQIGGANVQIGGLAPSELAGSRIWTATADPTTPNYTFARSALTGASGAPRVGDLVVRGYYRYTVSSVATSTVLTGNRTSIRGATGAQGPQGPQGEQGPQGAAGHSPEVTSTKNADGSVTILVDGTATSTVDAGEDGHSPTITTTKNSDGSVTIYVDGTVSSTVEAGKNGTSYYTYVRYSKNANGSGMVTTPTAETKYIGVYTGTNSSVPAYTSFKWSKYVGDDAAPLTVTATSVDYILSTSGTNPPADSANWQASPLAPTTTQYLWTRTTLTFSDGTTAKSYSVGGKVGEKGSAGPEAYVTITPSNINWEKKTATLTATLHVNGAKVTSGVTYAWAKGDTTLSTTTASCGITDLNATYSCTCTWSGNKQRGTIDFAASNSVKLAAEAGWKSDLGSYYTKTEVNTTVNGINQKVSGVETKLETISNPNLSPFFSMAPYRTATSYDGGYWQPTGDNWLMGGVTKLSDGWAHVTRGASTRLEVAIPRIESLSAGDKATLLIEWRDITVTGSPKLYARNYPDNCQFNLNSYEVTWNTSSDTSGSKLIVMTVNSTADGDKNWNAAINLGMNNGSSVSFDGDLRISIYEGEYKGSYKPYVDQSLIERVSTAETSIEQTANNVLIKATKSDTTAAQGGQHLIQSLINVAPEGVKIAADKVNIEGAAIFTSGRLSSTSLNAAYDAKGAAATAKSEAISTAATDATNKANAVQENLDNLQVGGRNLLRGTGTGEGWDYTSFDKETRTFTRSTTATGESYIGAYSTSYLMYELGTEYVLSCWAKSNGQVKDMDIFTYDQNTKNIKSRTCSVTTKWVRFIFPFKYDAWSTSSATPTGFLVRFDNNGSKTSGTEAILYVRDVKLERGNKASDWSPAPEDQTAYVDSVQVGGRNLVWDTAWNDVAHRWKTWGSPTTREIVEIGGKRWLHLVSTAASYQGYEQGYSYRPKDNEIAAGDKVTVSVTAYAASACKTSLVAFHWLNSSNTIVNQVWPSFDVTTTPQRFHATFTVPSGATRFNVMVGDGPSGVKELWISEVKLEKGNKASDWSPAPEDVDSAIEQSIAGQGGFDILWNRVAYDSDENAGGECYICAYEPTTAIRSNADGWAMWNGVKRTIPRGAINPNNIVPYNIPVYIVCRLSSATATTGTRYMVWYSGGWKYAVTPTPSAVGGTWTWAESTDMVIGKFVEPGLEVAFAECETYRQPLRWGAITTDTVTARSANANANANVRRTQRIYYRKATVGAPSVPTAWVTNGSVESSWTKYNAWSTRIPPIADSTSSTTKYPYLYTCEQYETAGGTTPQYTTVLLDDSTTIIDGGNIITGSIAANKLTVYDATIQKIRADAIDTKSISIGDLSGSIGGRNLVYDTADWSKWAKTSKATVSGDVLTCANTDTSSGFQRANGWFIPAKADVMDREVTVSFDAKKTDATALDALVFQMFTTSAAPKSVASGNIAEGTRVFKLFSAASTQQFVIENASDVNASSWTRVVFRFVPSEVFNTAGYTDLTYLALYLGIRNVVGSAQFRRVKVEYGSRSTDWTPAPEDQTAYVDESIDEIRVGGRNLLQGSDRALGNGSVTDTKTQFDMLLWSTTSESYTGYKTIFSKYGIKETGHHEYTFEAQNVSQQYWCIKHNGSTHDVTIYFKNSVTVVAGDTLTLSFDVVGYNPSVANGLLIKNFKLERGNKATDWSPAPEDIAATATKYITDISSGGMMVHPSNDANTGVQITSDVDILRAGTSVAKYGDTARIGKEAGARVTIAPSGLDMYGNTDGSVNLAHFGYASGNAESGTAVAPYYTLGTRASGSAIGNWSTVAGVDCTASGYNSFAEGSSTTASAHTAHAEGFRSKATNLRAHAEGMETTASGSASHSEGSYTSAQGNSSHSEGSHTVAEADYAHVQNYYTYTAYDYATAMGKYNADGNYALMIGNGTSSTRSNALTVDWDGNLVIAGGITLGTALTAAQIPSLAASKITSGTFAAARIPNLAASKITSGTFAAARIPAATASAAGAVTLPTALYSGTAKGNFTLTASAANYTRLRVFFTAANGGKGSVDVYSPNGSKFSCATTCLANSTTLQHEFAQWSISGTSVTWQNAGYVNLAVATSLGGSVTKLTATTNQITITRVEGWTW